MRASLVGSPRNKSQSRTALSACMTNVVLPEYLASPERSVSSPFLSRSLTRKSGASSASATTSRSDLTGKDSFSPNPDSLVGRMNRGASETRESNCSRVPPASIQSERSPFSGTSGSLRTLTLATKGRSSVATISVCPPPGQLSRRTEYRDYRRKDGGENGGGPPLRRVGHRQERLRVQEDPCGHAEGLRIEDRLVPAGLFDSVPIRNNLG